ncbi:hypothetical protein PMAYCL1PPCAC_25992, partial [Pristionchus mayeri]
CYSFTEPRAVSNVVLIVQGKKLYVNKEYLAMHSPVFAEMFFGEFADKEKKEYAMEHVTAAEFVDLLNVIHPGWAPITDTTVSHILNLADRLQMDSAINQAEYFLRTEDVQGGMAKKLRLAEKYNLE